MSELSVRLGSIASWATRKSGNRSGRESDVAVQNAASWETGEDRFDTLDAAPTRNKWNESKWFDIFTVLIIAALSLALCFKLGLI